MGSRSAQAHCCCAQIVRGHAEKGTLPSLADYLEAAAKRRQEKKTPPAIPHMHRLLSSAVH